MKHIVNDNSRNLKCEHDSKQNEKKNEEVLHRDWLFDDIFL